MVVPQFLQESSKLLELAMVVCSDSGIGISSPVAIGSGASDLDGTRVWLACALFGSRLLNAGQPLHPSAPPVPLHCPPPGHEPSPIVPSQELCVATNRFIAAGEVLLGGVINLGSEG
jgi:hypothetical protein